LLETVIALYSVEANIETCLPSFPFRPTAGIDATNARFARYCESQRLAEQDGVDAGLGHRWVDYFLTYFFKSLGPTSAP
jgi:hypothetical protein